MHSMSSLRPFWLLAIIGYLTYLSISSKSISSHVKSVVPHKFTSMSMRRQHEWSGSIHRGTSARERTSSRHRSSGVGISVAGGTNIFTAGYSARVTELLDQPFPKNIWQKSPLNLRRRNTRNIASWHKMNPGWRHVHLSDEESDEFVARIFKNRPAITRFWKRLTVPVVRSDVLRYLILLAKGGVYTDSDTECMEPIDEWIPEEYRNGKINAVVGIEWDSPPKYAFAKPVSFVQWTFMVKPGHPLMENMVSRAMANLELIARQQRKEVDDADLGFEDILFSTGPGGLSDSVVHHLQDQGIDFVPEMLSGIKEPKQLGDVLILPVNAFGWGQPHSHSGDPAYGKAFAKHKFDGSWFKTDEQLRAEAVNELGLAKPNEAPAAVDKAPEVKPEDKKAIEKVVEEKKAAAAAKEAEAKKVQQVVAKQKEAEAKELKKVVAAKEAEEIDPEEIDNSATENIVDAMDVLEEHEQLVAEEEEKAAKQKVIEAPGAGGVKPTFEKKGKLGKDGSLGAGRKSDPVQEKKAAADVAGGKASAKLAPPGLAAKAGPKAKPKGKSSETKKGKSAAPAKGKTSPGRLPAKKAAKKVAHEDEVDEEELNAMEVAALYD